MFRALIFILLFVLSAVAEDEREQFFEKKIRPVLVNHCYECHSVEADEASGGLLLDSRVGWHEGGDSGAAIAEGDPDQSRLVEAIAYTNRDLQMPPDNRLPQDVVDDFRKWIRDGAFDPREAKTQRNVEAFDLKKRASEHWAWQPCETFDDSHSIDQFIDAALERNSLSRATPANPNELVRRLSFDLIGLPPTTEQIGRFKASHAADPDQAIASLVERLLNSPRFGEKWASHWFDAVDYSETKGHVTDQERPYAWKYRDYVIDAFNSDLPYDRFVLEHIAGDLLPTELQRKGTNGEKNISPTATGVLYMHEMHYMAVDPVQQRWDEIDAQIDVVGKAFLGLTVECARCHDHKFDAVSQADYYALAGFFYSTEQGKQRIAPRKTPHTKAAKIADLEADYEDFLATKRKGRVAALTPKNKSGAYFPISEELGLQTTSDTAKLLKKMRAIERLDPSWAHWVRAAHDADGQDAALLIRGEYTNPSQKVSRRFLTAINSQTPSLPEGSGRLWLAEQITDRRNPFTSRVYANRVWHHLFNRGIVATPNDFGKLGEPPTHPELLDYLAQRLIENDWSTKSLIREIVLSKTYQQSSLASDQATELDPENKWLSHQNRRRLSAEQLRDAMLAVSKSIDLTMYGPGVDPYVLPFATANKTAHIPKAGPIDGANRRSVYIKVRRNYFDPFLRSFDFPDRGKPVGCRGVTIAPNQALAMLNSPLVHELAADWGKVADKNDATIRDIIQGMWFAGLGRSPSEQEMQTSLDLLEQFSRSEPHRLKHVAHLVFNHPDFMWID